MILGLTGSLGSGKSTVARMLTELGGARVIDADAITHAVQQPGGPAYEPVVELFGPEVVQPDGTLDRARIASIVFADPEQMRRLTAIVHPAVRREELRLLEAHRGEPLVVFMVPLLFENGLDRYVDRTVVVTVGEAARRERLVARGMTPDDIERRLAAQMPEAEKARRADYVIDNSGTLEATRAQVKALLETLGVRPAAESS
mgnify:CR=1 FL=1